MGSIIRKRQFSIHPNADIEDNTTTTNTIAVEDEGIVREITIKADLKHSYYHDLVITLTDPDGTKQTIYDQDIAGKREDAEHTDKLLIFTVDTKPALQELIGKKSRGNWILKIEDKAGQDTGKLKEWSLELGIADLELNGLRINNNGYVGIARRDDYNFKKGAFSVMAFICPKKTVNGQTEMTTGTIFSSKPSTSAGGWELKIVKEGDTHLLCLYTWDNLGCYCLSAPIDNLYDDKRTWLARRDSAEERASAIAADITKAKTLFKEYTHYVAATRDTDGTICLYVNGYVLAKVTTKTPSSGNGADGFRLTGMYKETIDNPTHFFSLDRKLTGSSPYSVGTLNLVSDELQTKGAAFSLSSSTTAGNTVTLSPHENGVSDIYANTTGSGYSRKISLSIKPVGKEKKLLAKFQANRPALLDVSISNNIGLSIGRTERSTDGDHYEGYMKHVSLWKTALSQADIISYMDHIKLESDSTECVGFWKLENDYKDYSSKRNHGTKSGEMSFIHQHQILPLYMEEQQNSNWCWAATALSVIEFYDPLSTTSQADIVKAIYGTAINEPGWTSLYLKKASNHMKANYYCNRANWGTGEFVYGTQNNKIDFDYLTSEIDNWNPICVSVKWKDRATERYLNTGHIMTLSGVKNDNQTLIINDPWNGVYFVKYDDFVNGRYPGNGTWISVIPTSANENIIHSDEQWKIEKEGYKLTFQSDGNFCVYKNGSYLAGTAAGADYFKVSSLEFRLDGTLAINTRDDVRRQIVVENPQSNYSPKPPYKLDLKINGNEWDVVVKDTEKRNLQGQVTESEMTLYSIKKEFITP